MFNKHILNKQGNTYLCLGDSERKKKISNYSGLCRMNSGIEEHAGDYYRYRGWLSKSHSDIISGHISCKVKFQEPKWQQFKL